MRTRRIALRVPHHKTDKGHVYGRRHLWHVNGSPPVNKLGHVDTSRTSGSMPGCLIQSQCNVTSIVEI